MHLSVIVPAYNEESCLEKNIIEYLNYLHKLSFGSELIIVNDGSTDSTGKIADNLAQIYDTVRAMHLEKNQGKGAAVRAGLRRAQGKYRLFLDADSSTSIDHLEKTWDLLEKGAGLVIGSRSKRDAENTEQKITQPLWKRFCGLAGNRLIRSLTDCDIKDTQCGFKILTEAAARDIVPEMTINGFAFDLEMLMLAKKYGHNTAIIPVNWVNSPDSKVKIKNYLDTLAEVLQIKWRLQNGFYNK